MLRMKSVINYSVKRGALVGMMCLLWMTVQAQVKVCMNYGDFKADKWKPYTDLMEHHILYLIDKEPNAKGKIVMTRLNDQFMEKLLRDDPVTFEQYYGRNKKGNRQSAANILPILVKKGLISDYHH